MPHFAQPTAAVYIAVMASWAKPQVEGLNNKAKVTMRRSYGFRTFRVLELALYHSLGKLPEPESTHDFSDESKISCVSCHCT
jgi:hypothetical protein